MPASAPHTVPAADDQTPRHIRGMFDAISPTYDRLNRLLSGWLDQRWRALAARRVLEGLAPASRLVDVATGTGDLARALARRRSKMNGEPFTVVGIDFSGNMLAQARRKFPAAPFTWTQADGLRLPLRGGEADALTIAFGLRNMVDKPAALAEFARVLRPGGRVAILEFSQPSNPIMRRLYDFYSFRVMPRVGRWVSGSPAYGYLAGSIRAFWGPDELTGQMRRAGFREIRATSLMMGIVYLHVGTREDEGQTGDQEAGQ